MTPENIREKEKIAELLGSRYKVIADYPGNGNPVGSIIQIFEGNNPVTKQQKEFYNKYLHLFKPLAWYEERETREMPGYIKCDETPLKGTVAKVIEWRGCVNSLECRIEKYRGAYNPGQYRLIPATETEYQNYLKSKS